MAQNGDVSLADLYQDLINCPPGVTRSTKLQTYCETFWSRLKYNPLPSSVLIDDFIRLLQNDDDLLLARLVIPPLRPTVDPPDNPILLEILGHINSDRTTIQSLNSRPQLYGTQTNAHFLEEKRILQETELYRASLLLYGHSNTNEAQRQRLQEWLAAYPTEEAATSVLSKQ
ncbi:hypothetical protein AA0113_g6028 [Alternaria arborescens]|uniref:Uncharacterized protein n=1 Tax=Alternaria arborescens TaxID=156630 RepID=A0A4V1X5L0_9PLEO|nr:hypothetical protein AA0113_g6028 [Alternaria arborescens]